MFGHLREILAKSGIDLADEELLDVLWLARNLPGDVRPMARRPLPAAPSQQDTGQGKSRTETDDPSPPGVHPPPDAVSHRLFPLHAAPRGKAGGTLEPDLYRAHAVRAPGPHALPSGHPTLGRALRPLRQRLPDRRRRALDVARTVDAMAETGLPEIVTSPARSRWLSLALLIDDGVSMVLWKRLASEIRTLTERAGAFRDVRVFGLDTRNPQAPLLRNRPFRQQGPYLPPAALCDPTGGTLVLMVSDGVGDAWWDGRMSEAAALWARRQPTAILQVLPFRLWPNSGITTRPWHVTSVRRGGPTTAWHVTDPTLPADLAGFHAAPVPVLEPTLAALGDWARLVASPSASAVLPLWDTGQPVPRHWRAEIQQEADAEAVLRFRGAASPEAYRLAAHLAAVAPVTPPVMRMVQEALGPPTDAGHLVEVLLGGLMRNATADPTGRSPQPEFFDFADDARRILLGTLPARELLRTTRLIADRLAASVRHSPSFTAWVAHPGGAAAVDTPERSFARLEERLLKRLGVTTHIESADAGRLPPVQEPPEARARAQSLPPAAQRAGAKPPATPSTAETKAKILLVDDRPDNLLALEAALSSLDQTLIRASSGEEALEALDNDAFALVLLATQMSGMDGYETIAHIKRRSRSRDTPVILVSAYGLNPDATFRGYAAGAVDYLSRPYDPWTLRAKVLVFVDVHLKNVQLAEQVAMLRAAGTSEVAARLSTPLSEAEKQARELTGHLQGSSTTVRNTAARLERAISSMRQLLRDASQLQKQSGVPLASTATHTPRQQQAAPDANAPDSASTNLPDQS
jgi:CheY-like chemotaxis protein